MPTYANGIRIKNGKYSLKCGINVNQFCEFLKSNQNEKGFVNIEIKERKEEGKYGETHYAVLDEWKPAEKIIEGNDFETQKKMKVDASEMKNNKDLPF